MRGRYDPARTQSEDPHYAAATVQARAARSPGPAAHQLRVADMDRLHALAETFSSCRHAATKSVPYARKLLLHIVGRT